MHWFITLQVSSLGAFIFQTSINAFKTEEEQRYIDLSKKYNIGITQTEINNCSLFWDELIMDLIKKNVCATPEAYPNSFHCRIDQLID